MSIAYLIVGNAATIRCLLVSRADNMKAAGCTHRRVSDLAVGHGDIEVHADEDAL